MVGVKLAAVVFAIVALIFLIYSSPGSSAPQSPPPAGASPAASGGIKMLRNFSSYEELVRFVSLVGEAEVAYGYVPYAVVPAVTRVAVPAAAQVAGDSARRAFSATNVQVAGVDELDIVKTDGRIIAVATGEGVYLIDAAARRLISAIRLNSTAEGLFLWGDALAVVTVRYPIRGGAVASTALEIYDISNPHAPAARGAVVYTGTLVGARMINGTVYLVLSAPARPEGVPTVNGAPIRPERVYLVDLLPSSFTTVAAVDLNSGERGEVSLLISPATWIYMSATRLYVASSASPYAEALAKALEILADVAPGEVGARIRSELQRGNLTGALKIARRYVASLPAAEAEEVLRRVSTALSAYVFNETTRIHVFSVRGVDVAYQGYVDLQGRVLDQFSLEEYKGYLIVATTASNYTASLVEPKPTLPPIPTTDVGINVVECRESQCSEQRIVIRPPPTPPYWPPIFDVVVTPRGESLNNVFVVSPAELRVVGRLGGLAKGERIYAARLVGDLFFLVTFRQVDPLYAVDVSNPEKPAVLGFLKIPGYSEYLHPLGGGMLLGVGVENGSLKVSLFDASNPRDIREVAYVKLEGSRSPALFDHHAFTIRPDKKLVMIPVTARYYGIPAGIAAISFSDGLRLLHLMEHWGAVRSLYVNDTVFTIATDSVKIFDIDTFREQAEIPLR